MNKYIRLALHGETFTHHSYALIESFNQSCHNISSYNFILMSEGGNKEVFIYFLESKGEHTHQRLIRLSLNGV